MSVTASPLTPATLAPAAAAVPPHVSWLKHFGLIIGKILKFVAGSAAPIADQAAKVAEVLLPQFSTEIAVADNLISNIAKQAIVTEALAAGTATQPTGPQKLQYVLSNIGGEIDQWVASRFPGATQVSAAAKAGLVNAVVAITNELQPSLAASTASPAAAATPAAKAA